MNGIGDFVTSIKEVQRLAAQVAIELKGDTPGHPFRGNQYDGGSGGGESGGALDVSGIGGSSSTALKKRADVFNKAFSRSEVGREEKARAEILKDGRLEYSKEKKRSDESTYRIKLSYREALNMLNGEDMRAIHGAMVSKQ